LFNQFCLTARGGDLFCCRFTETMRFYGKGLSERAFTEDFQGEHLFFDHFFLEQHVSVDRGVGVETFKVLYVDYLPLRAEPLVIEPSFRQAPYKGHLPAFESRVFRASRARKRTFMASPAGLSHAGTAASSHSLAVSLELFKRLYLV
jgi:hypothetical protein